MTITTGAILSTNTTTDESSAIYSSKIQGNQISNYDSELPIYNPAGFFSIPIPNAQALFHQSPYAGTGYIQGFFNESPSITNVKDLIEGESAICETATYNFNIQAKLDGLKSIFKNNNNDIITTNLAISENIVTILTDIIAEIVTLETSYNALITKFNNFNTAFLAHAHTGVQTGGGTSGPTTTQFPNNNSYSATSNFNRDKTFLSQSPSKMYITVNGELIS